MKMTEIMLEAAKELTPHKGDYFGCGSACALGLLIYWEHRDGVLYVNKSKIDLPEEQQRILNTDYDITDFPRRYRRTIESSRVAYGQKYVLFQAVTAVNDHMSRYDAIQMLIEMGY